MTDLTSAGRSGRHIALGAFVLAGAIGQFAAGFLPDILGWDQTIATRADATGNPLIPFGAAFLIWLPLFIGSVWFGWRVLVGPGSSVNDPSVIALPAGIAFWINAIYSLVSPLAGIQLMSSALVLLIFLPALFAVLSVPDMQRLGFADRVAFAAIDAFAGWITVASTVSVAAILDGIGFIDFSAGSSPILLVVLALGGGVAVYVGLKTRSIWYSLAVTWGLFWLAVQGLWITGDFAIGSLAAVGCGASLIVAIVGYRRV